jgi:MazG family protein
MVPIFKRNLLNSLKRHRPVYIQHNNSEMLNGIDKLIDVIKHLRNPEHGCEWDLKQNNVSLKDAILEETYELIESIENNNFSDIQEELGDMLFIVLIHIYIFIQDNKINFNDITDLISDKLIRRHPHIFKGLKVSSTDEILVNWENIKKNEKKNKSDNEVINSIPRNMPALQRLYRLIGKMYKLNLLSVNKKQVISKLEKSVNLFKKNQNENNFTECLYYLVSLAYLNKIKPENSLHKKINNFISNFNGK